MPADYIALSVVAIVGVGAALWALHEAKKYRARADAEKAQAATSVNDENTSTRVTPVGGNIFADLGFEPMEAERLLAESDRVISENFAVRQALIEELGKWIESHKLEHAEVAAILGLTIDRVSALSEKRITQFSIDTLVNMLIRAGKGVRISVQ